MNSLSSMTNEFGNVAFSINQKHVDHNYTQSYTEFQFSLYELLTDFHFFRHLKTFLTK